MTTALVGKQGASGQLFSQVFVYMSDYIKKAN
jgi:hypothetical protein